MANIARLASNQATLYFAIAAAAAIALVVLTRKGVASSTGVAVGRAVVDLVDGIIVGTVKRIGDVVGVPDTNLTECQRAIREGRTWDASFACPASDFLKHVFGSSNTNTSCTDCSSSGRGATGRW